MNKNMQIAVIKKSLKNKGIDADTIDLESYVDGRLSLEENLNDIMATIKFIMPIEKRNVSPTQDINKIERYEKAVVLESLRSARARRRDNAVTAKHNYALTDLNKENYERWKKHPNRNDINGIDNYNKAY